MLDEATFIQAGTWRYLLGVVVLSLINIRHIPRFQVLRKNARPLFGIGLIGLFGFNMFFFLALQYTSPVNAALIVALNPITTTFISHYILKSSITKSHLLGSLLALTGVVILLTRGDWQILKTLRFSIGDLFMLIANILFALYHVWVKKYSHLMGNQEFTWATNCICLLGFFMVLPIQGKSITLVHTPGFYLATFGCGALGTAIAYLLWNRGVTLTGPHKAGLFMNVVPFATVVSAIALGQQLHTFHAVSGVIIITGVLIAQDVFSRKRPTAPG